MQWPREIINIACFRELLRNSQNYWVEGVRFEADDTQLIHKPRGDV